MLRKRNYNPTYLNMTGFPLRQENLETENGYGKVMEKSKNMKKRTKVMEYCHQSWNSTHFATNCTRFVCSFATTKRLSIDV